MAKPESMTDIELDGVAADLKGLRECATLALHSVYVAWGSNIFDRCDQFKNCALERPSVVLSMGDNRDRAHVNGGE